MVNANNNRKRTGSSGPSTTKKPKFDGRSNSNGPPSAQKQAGKAKKVAEVPAKKKAEQTKQKTPKKVETKVESPIKELKPKKQVEQIKQKAPKKVESKVTEKGDAPKLKKQVKKVVESPVKESKPKKQIKKVTEKGDAPKPKKHIKKVAKPVIKNASKGLVSENAENGVPVNEVDSGLVAENDRRLVEQTKRSLYVGLQGKLNKVANSVLKALHPDILNVKRIANSAFLIFTSQAVRDKAFPVIQKARIKNHPLKVDYCCDKSSGRKPKKVYESSALNLKQLTVTDFPTDTTQSMLEIVFPKANDIKKIPNQSLAYVNFAEESDALEAFKKGKVLKISSVPVVVRFRMTDAGKKLKKLNGHDENEEPETTGDETSSNLSI